MENVGADVSVLFGLKTPTGNTRETDREGARFETEFQPGSGEWRRKQTVSGRRDPNSGGTMVLISPGARMNVSDRFSAFVSTGIPVIRDLNGTQHETRHRFVAGISAGL